MIEFNKLIENLIKHLCDLNIPFGKTRLIKIAYLIEVEYYRNHRQMMTNAEWIFYKFGPYPINCNDYLEQTNIILDNDNEANFSCIKYKDYKSPPELPQEVLRLISVITKNYALWDINSLLDYVYFETEPMKGATPRSKLNFENIEPKEKTQKVKIILSQKKFKELEKRKKGLRDHLITLDKPKFQENNFNDEWFDDELDW